LGLHKICKQKFMFGFIVSVAPDCGNFNVKLYFSGCCFFFASSSSGLSPDGLVMLNYAYDVQCIGLFWSSTDKLESIMPTSYHVMHKLDVNYLRSLCCQTSDLVCIRWMPIINEACVAKLTVLVIYYCLCSILVVADLDPIKNMSRYIQINDN
jgi:hypothetical protein